MTLEVAHYYQDNAMFHHLAENSVFVFGSNLRGIHGKGAALTARRCFGAQLGVGEGMTGQSYALPTKESPYLTLPLAIIDQHVQRFLLFAQEHQDKKFVISPIGTKNAGYKDADIAPMFQRLPTNCCVTKSWLAFIAHQTAFDVTHDV